MPELNVIKKYAAKSKNVQGLFLRVISSEEMLENDMVGVGVDFRMTDGRKMETPIDLCFGFVDADGSHSLLFFFNKLNPLYEPIGFSSDDKDAEPFNFPPLIA